MSKDWCLLICFLNLLGHLELYEDNDWCEGYNDGLPFKFCKKYGRK